MQSFDTTLDETVIAMRKQPVDEVSEKLYFGQPDNGAFASRSVLAFPGHRTRMGTHCESRVQRADDSRSY